MISTSSRAMNVKLSGPPGSPSGAAISSQPCEPIHTPDQVRQGPRALPRTCVRCAQPRGVVAPPALAVTFMSAAGRDALRELEQLVGIVRALDHDQARQVRPV